MEIVIMENFFPVKKRRLRVEMKNEGIISFMPMAITAFLFGMFSSYSLDFLSINYFANLVFGCAIIFSTMFYCNRKKEVKK